MSCCILVQRADYVVVLGVVDVDLADMELCFCLLEPHMRLGGPERGQFERNCVLLILVFRHGVYHSGVTTVVVRK